MKYLSVCSGIEAASVAWEPLGWSPVAFSEIEPFPSAVLAHHWPEVPNLGDMTNHHEWKLTTQPDIIVGGTPCQAFSTSGLRRGLEDHRGALAFEYLRIVERYCPTWVVWENVVGVLSDKGRAFGTFLRKLGECGYGFAYRILNSEYFGVAQRRRRVFVVGCLGSWRCPAAVLFESKSLFGNLAADRSESSKNPSILEGGDGVGGSRKLIQGRHEYIHPGVVGTLSSCGRAAGSAVAQDVVSKLMLVFRVTGNRGAWELKGKTDTLTTGTSPFNQVAVSGSQVRRLTPLEWERLQGFPDNHTRIPWRGKPAELCPDGPRYKAIGNSMAVPVMRWIGKRIQSLQNLDPILAGDGSGGGDVGLR